MSFAWSQITMPGGVVITRWQGSRIWGSTGPNPTASEMAVAIGRAMWAWKESR